MVEDVSINTEMEANTSCIGNRKETDLSSSPMIQEQTDKDLEPCTDVDNPSSSASNTKEEIIRDFKRQLSLAEKIETIDENGREVLENLVNTLNTLILDQQVPSTPPRQSGTMNRRLPLILRVSMEENESSIVSPLASMPIINGRSSRREEGQGNEENSLSLPR